MVLTDFASMILDTADTYSNGESELCLGEAIRRFNIPREQVSSLYIILSRILYHSNLVCLSNKTRL